MGTMNTIHKGVMERVAELLRATADLAGVKVLRQDDQELAFLLEKELDQLDGLVAVVTVDTVEKSHGNPATFRVSFSVMVTEILPINRENPGFMTAIDVAETCGEAVDAAQFGHFDRVRHETPGDGILTAIAECSGEFRMNEEQGE